MKKIGITLLLGILLTSTSAHAGNGDLLVDGKIGAGVPSPQVKADIGGDLQVAGFGHFKGWGADGGGLTGLGVDVGVSSGKGYIMPYDRTSGTYGQLRLDVGSAYLDLTPDPSGAYATGEIYLAGHVGVGGSPGGYYLLVNGPMYAVSVAQSSDRRFKRDIAPISDPLKKVLQLNGVSYEFNTDDFKDRGFPAGRHNGVIAQDLEKVMPDAVVTAKDGYKGVVYSEIIPVLIEAIKGQQKQIDDLKAQLSK